MPPPFRKVSVSQFADLLQRFPFQRKVLSVHMHHTFRPNHAQFKGHDSIVAMWRFHTKTNGWSDIAQHITIDPNGEIWMGRNWNRSPASAVGFNGTSKAGPFMFEMIGDFDKGRDSFGGAQEAAAVQVVANLFEKFGLKDSDLVFHREMSGKTCPGNSIDKAAFLAKVGQARQQLAKGTSRSAAVGPFPPEAYEINALLREMSSERNLVGEADGELDCETYNVLDEPQSRGGERFFGGGLTTEEKARLRPHVVNMTRGVLKEEGNFSTTPADLERIFEDEIPAYLAGAKNPRLVVFAHGGLVSETSGLKIALRHVDWWRRNGIYPLYFIWETGLLETIGQLIRSRKTRDIFDRTTDRVIEEVARGLGGVLIWGGMKDSARLASEPEGAAFEVARRLAKFKDKLSIHLVGHSAGSIFHGHFLQALAANKVKADTADLLAPAIRADLFKKTFIPQLGNGLKSLRVYTMRKDFELDDNCLGVYRKSLLYLIHHGLEPNRRCPLLGLEETLRSDLELANLFGLRGNAGSARVYFSVTEFHDAIGATQSTTHGNFDNDAPTMNSMLREILGVDDKVPLEHPYPEETRAFELSDAREDLPEWVQAALADQAPTPPSDSAFGPVSVIVKDGKLKGHALSIGINKYPTQPLGGCVQDAMDWNEFFADRFNDNSRMLDGDATYDNIRARFKELVGTAEPGDVLAISVSGHGTRVPDHDSDEDDATDEAFVPIDFDKGHLLIDDDIREIFNGLKDGVNLTCFFDTCHSGTITRLFETAGQSSNGTRKARFMVPTGEMLTKHRQFREDKPKRNFRSLSAKKAILFSACQPHEVAYEENGQGDFSRHALGILRGGGNITHELFQKRVTEALGPNRRQNPHLDCEDARKVLSLLRPF